MNQHPFNLSSMLVKAEADAKQAHARNDELVSERFALKAQLAEMTESAKQWREGWEAERAREIRTRKEAMEAREALASMTAERDDQRDAARQWEKTSCAWQLAHDRVTAERDALRPRICPGECNDRRERVDVALTQRLEAYKARDQARARLDRLEHDFGMAQTQRNEAHDKLKALKAEKDAMLSAQFKRMRDDHAVVLKAERERERAKVTTQLREWGEGRSEFALAHDSRWALRSAADLLDAEHRPPAEPKPGDGEGKQ